MSNKILPLQNIGVLVTRPATRADNLCRLIEARGGRAIRLPLLEITPPADAAALHSALQRLNEVALAIFVSVHAVEGVAAALTSAGLRLPSRMQVAAVGEKTAAACARAGFRADFMPQIGGSEGLADALRGLALTDKKVLIFRGQSGREALKAALEARGATVEYAECYRRRRVAAARLPVDSVLAEVHGGRVHWIVIGSGAVWDALREVFIAHAEVFSLPVLAYSRRVAEYCRATAAGEVRFAPRPDDAAVADAITRFAR